MGMYTELVLATKLSKDTPAEVIDILYYMLEDGEYHEGMILPEHPLFATEGWRIMLQCDSGNFPGKTYCKLETVDITYRDYNLTIRCNLKNYDHEIEWFLNFLKPYMESYGCLGYMRKEDTYEPTLIYHFTEPDRILLSKVWNRGSKVNRFRLSEDCLGSML